MAGMHFLLTNDDGIDAPGLEALQQALEGLGQWTVIAPQRPLSGCSHRVTTHRELELVDHGDKRHALDGTPVDCTRVGLVHWPREVDWVIAGINDGGNLGADVYMSGTVAAAREATLLGKPAIAISQYRARRAPLDWQRASLWSSVVIRMLLEKPKRPGRYWNVNLPDPGAVDEDVPEIVFCPLDPHPMPVRFEVIGGRLQYAATYQERQRMPGRDVQRCFAGQITVTELPLHGDVPPG